MKPLKPGSQRRRLLNAFYLGQTLHRFQAEALGCHVLPTLVSEFESIGLRFERRMIDVPSRWGADAHVAQYWLSPSSRALAAQLLGLGRPDTLTDATKAAARAYSKASGG
jgi:hypothetical protein